MFCKFKQAKRFAKFIWRMILSVVLLALALVEMFARGGDIADRALGALLLLLSLIIALRAAANFSRR